MKKIGRGEGEEDRKRGGREKIVRQSGGRTGRGERQRQQIRCKEDRKSRERKKVVTRRREYRKRRGMKADR